MNREILNNGFVDTSILCDFGISNEMIYEAINYTYNILDSIDEKLISNGEARMADLLELANLSAIIGNLFRGGFAKGSDGRFIANGPHKYPDLLANQAGYSDLEIKVALESNKPKGHLVKPGPHITVRYVLSHEDGSFQRGKDKRGNIVSIWEVRVGQLDEKHFSVSNTDGDSGKTAVINKEGMTNLSVVYLDIDKCPYPSTGRVFKDYQKLLEK